MDDELDIVNVIKKLRTLHILSKRTFVDPTVQLRLKNSRHQAILLDSDDTGSNSEEPDKNISKDAKIAANYFTMNQTDGKSNPLRISNTSRRGSSLSRVVDEDAKSYHEF